MSLQFEEQKTIEKNEFIYSMFFKQQTVINFVIPVGDVNQRGG
jgi:hypothetical protein